MGLIRALLWPARLPPALPLGISFHCRGCILGSEGGIPLAVLLRFGAHLHQPGGSFLDAPSPVERCHTPDKVGTAHVRAGFAMILGSVLKAALIVRPSARAYRRFMPAGNSKGKNGRLSYGLRRGYQPQSLKLGRRGNTAGGSSKDSNGGKSGSYLRL